ncbi:hypothetical protein BDR26DRAFT_112210 [Obelidium mucronatum]|nr:hypothetical protein BDR26DRAFT_112210 [Obelidium mucronatum]
MLHDGGTLANKHKFQAIGIQFLDPQWRKNHVVSIGFTASAVNTDSIVSEMLQAVFKERTGLEFQETVSSMMQDRCALGVSNQCDIEEEACLMHDGDKLGRSAVGALTRSRNKIVVNPFPEGVDLMSRAHKMGTFFSYSQQRRQHFQDVCATIGDIPVVGIQLDLSTTRVASSHQLLFSIRVIAAFVCIQCYQN